MWLLRGTRFIVIFNNSSSSNNCVVGNVQSVHFVFNGEHCLIEYRAVSDRSAINLQSVREHFLANLPTVVQRIKILLK